MNALKSMLLVFVCAFLIVGCKAKKDKTSDGLDQFQEGIEGMIPSVESYNDIATLLNFTNIGYLENIGNDPGRVLSYQDNPFVTAANLGIYTADALYYFLYHDNEKASESYRAALALAEQLEMTGVYDEKVQKRLTEGIESTDSIVWRFDEALKKSGADFTSRDRKRLFVSMLAGNFIEKEYIFTELLFNDPNIAASTDPEYREDLLILIVNAKPAIEELAKLFKEFSDPDDPGIWSTEIYKLNEVYKELPNAADLGKLTSEPRAYKDKLTAAYNQIRATREVFINP